MAPRRYTSDDEDSARWEGFEFRDGDVVISTRSKHGTTWVQTIVLLLVHRTTPFPAPLATLSPWLDHLVEPRDRVLARLAAQRHRRVIKTHTPLDGIPVDPRATYVVVGRHPLDAAVSLYHQGANLDRSRLHTLTGEPAAAAAGARPPLEAWLRSWVERDVDPRSALDSLPGVFWHLSDAWARRDENVVLVHYDDLLADLDGQFRRLAVRLDLAPPDDAGELVAAATFDRMREHAAELVPDPVGVLRDARAFFRGGRSGAGAALLDAEALARYHERAAELAPAELLTWLHRG